MSGRLLGPLLDTSPVYLTFLCCSSISPRPLRLIRSSLCAYIGQEEGCNPRNRIEVRSGPLGWRKRLVFVRKEL